jgi:heme/copper-type cytochrome/quinol oxidase subunit 3
MSTVSAVETYPTTISVQESERGKLGIWWFLASEVMVFGGFIAVYILYRMASGGAWTEFAHHVSTPIATLNTLILLTSSLTMVKAFQALQEGDSDWGKRYLVFTIVLGLAFLGVKGFEYSREISLGYTPLAGAFWSFYYALTGLHALHVLAGIIANSAVLGLVARGEIGEKGQRRVECAGLYWHFVDIVWIFLFPLIYLSY